MNWGILLYAALVIFWDFISPSFEYKKPDKEL